MIERIPPPVPERVAYYHYGDMCNDAKRFCPPWAVLKVTDTVLALGLIDENADVTVKVVFDQSFSPIISRQGTLVTRKSYDVEHNGLASVLRDLEGCHWCPGSVPRAKSCLVAVDTAELCRSCKQVTLTQEQQERRVMQPKTPLTSCSRPVLLQEVRNVRMKLKATQAELDSIQRKLQTETVSLEDDVKEGLGQVLSNADIQDPFLKLFWEEQQKASSRDPRGMRWHPTMIRFAIYLQFQSPRAYEALRNTGVLHLPNKSTLRDYTNFHGPKEGFSTHVFEDLERTASALPENKRFVALMLDEMAIRGDLVYDHRGGSVIGFINPLTWNFKPETEQALASHMLVFMIVGINNNIKMSVGYFSTLSATSDVLFPLLWMAVMYLEQNGLKVITVTSDKASPNQRLYRLHGDTKTVHETVNVFAQEDRQIFFISDAPHLLKTLRNNLEHSKAGGTRCLWHNGKHIWWSHIYQVYLDDTTNELRRTKLRAEHVNLTPSSRMSVRLAVQVVSRTVGLVMREHFGQDVSETADFVLRCDRFFDCMNTRSLTEHVQKRKPDLAPYRTLDDPRFEYLESFVRYLDDWKDSVQRREGFSKAEKEKMFITHQTYEGIVTTVRGFIGATRYLLNHGTQYVLSNNFCQDPIEEHFGRHRGLGSRSRNPSAFEFGHQENRLRLQRDLAFQFRPRGNTAGRPANNDAINVDHQPLPKIRRT